ncbi:PepSY-associated TM helix domain-containing protein [Neobacillus sp. M.A.Huq-85]|nr:PepSY-associated TM helix domain-containing protein [Neobacillus cucumis]
MKKTRKAHLWIGLIASVLILMESITGLLMNEPWLVGQSTQMEGKGSFQPQQMNQGTAASGSSQTAGQANAQNQEQNSLNGQSQTSGQTSNGQPQGQMGSNANGQFLGQKGMTGGPGGERGTSGSFMGIIRGLHEGRIGTTNIKWLIDLTALAMIFLTGSGIFLSMKVLRADKIRRNRKNGEKAVV